ncbi:MAG: hypothetical protein AB4063_01890 [Crocosphaera sp.]
MKLNKLIFMTVLSLSLLLGTEQISTAQMNMNPSDHQLVRIKQPLSLKILVTLGGLGLIGAEIWWFLFSQTTSK